MKSGLEELLTEDEVREACAQYAIENLCYGTEFVTDSEFNVVSNIYAYYYRIETFAEKREIKTRSEPYRGQTIDSQANRLSPGLWDIPVELPTLFKEGKRKLEVPHSASIWECLKCAGLGYVRCEVCCGMTWRNCTLCVGGIRRGRTCIRCSGDERIRCDACNETGRVRCKVCVGYGRMKHYKELTVTWTTQQDSFRTEVGSFPRPLLLKVTKSEVFKEQNLMVTAITNCLDQSINEASKTFVAKHRDISCFQVIRMQRHSLRAVPISKCTYCWKNKTGEFYVYGFEKKVHFESYPQKCSLCTLL